MNFLRTILFFCLSLFGITTILAQSAFSSAKVLSKSDSSIIGHAHIINLNSKIGVISNEIGEFTIPTKQEDTLTVSFIGYETMRIAASDLKDIVYLNRALYNIEPYTVLPYKNYREFRDAFTNLELEDTIKHKMNPSIMAFVEPFNPANLNGGITFSGPISAIASKFNKRIKDKKNYDRLIARDQYKAYLATKFNPKIIRQSTNLKEEYEIYSFMEYCDFSDQFIEHSTQYRLVNQIINCFEEYSNLPLANN